MTTSQDLRRRQNTTYRLNPKTTVDAACSCQPRDTQLDIDDAIRILLSN